MNNVISIAVFYAKIQKSVECHAEIQGDRARPSAFVTVKHPRFSLLAIVNDHRRRTAAVHVDRV